MDSLRRIKVHIKKDTNTKNKTMQLTSFLSQRNNQIVQPKTNRSVEDSNKIKKYHEKLKFELSLIRRDIDTKFNSSKLREYNYPIYKKSCKFSDDDSIDGDWTNKSIEYSGFFQEHIYNMPIESKRTANPFESIKQRINKYRRNQGIGSTKSIKVNLTSKAAVANSSLYPTTKHINISSLNIKKINKLHPSSNLKNPIAKTNTLNTKSSILNATSSLREITKLYNSKTVKDGHKRILLKLSNTIADNLFKGKSNIA